MLISRLTNAQTSRRGFLSGCTLVAAATVPLITVPLATAPAHAALPTVRITRIYYDSPGSDRRSNASLNGEYVTIRNATTKAIDLEGWTVRDKTGYRYRFGPVTLRSGKQLTLRTGKGRDSAGTVYWNRGQYVWNNDRDTAYLRDPSGTLVDSCSYTSTRRDSVTC